MRVHFMGIGGSGASAAAHIAQSQGFIVTGCDKSPFNEFTTEFDKNLLFTDHSPDHLQDIDLLVITPAILSLDSDNLEVVTAQKRGITVMTWQEFMGKYLEKDKFVIAVCGTHGKSTTAAMIGVLLEDAGLDPIVELGAIIPRWKRNFRIGKGKLVLREQQRFEGYFVTEADEFNDNFLVSHPQISVVTTIEMDHPEYFADFTAYKKSFAQFLSQTKQKIIANLADPAIKEILADYQAQIIDYSQKLIDFPLQIPGEYNRWNASAVYQVGLSLGIDPEIIKKSLSNFTGASRRFELMGEYQGAKVYSDFAHHPTELKVTLQAACDKFPDKKIIVIFQPHMFSRTHVLFNDFVKVFQQLPVDKAYILDIFPSREVDKGLVNSKQLVKAINKESVVYTTKEQVFNELKKVNSDNIVFFVGAGTTHDLAKELLKK